MNKFIKKLFGFFRNNTFERLRTAVENDNIQKAYKILSTKTVDVNQKIYDEIPPPSAWIRKARYRNMLAPKG